MGRLDDGFATLITFGEDSDVQLWEKEVTPPSIEGGGENDVTTMKNTTYRTRKPKQLITIGECSMTAAYDTVAYTEILAMVNVNQEITITFPDGSTYVFWGWIDAFKPNATTEGEQPTAEITIIASNLDNSDVETAPVHTP